MWNQRTYPLTIVLYVQNELDDNGAVDDLMSRRGLSLAINLIKMIEIKKNLMQEPWCISK